MPRTQKSLYANEGIRESSGQQRTTNANLTSFEHERVQHDNNLDPTSGDSPGNQEPVFGLLDPSILLEGTHARSEPALRDWQMAQAKPWPAIPGENLDWDLQLYSNDFTNPLHDDLTVGHAQTYHRVDLRHRCKTGVSDDPNSAMGMPEKAAPVRTGMDELLRLQCHLSNLLTGASEPATPRQPALDEVMMACKDLLELLQGRQLNCSRPSTPEHPHGKPCPAALDPLRINYISALQVATSYAYTLELLDLAVDNLKTRVGNLALVSLGIFNLASQPAMSISVGAYMISSMIHQLRDAISLLTLEHRGKPSPHVSSTGGLQAATTTDSIQAAVNMVHEMETSLLEKLSQVMNNPFSGSIALGVGGNHMSEPPNLGRSKAEPD
ncbi:hypothetical protein N7448_001090 [Penicillium atrosanguineum]|uniref:uncharacterized protein n=1 Tax=Penicillium atrosanguineum TaxID=1132637 RepID=UPI0023900E7D|nr:uncharacterized protein N7443_004486 [Penicillium atrosanguineum]KAJ5149512.1 hypothetical protein N7448_001090 [Penicillium atrosanguineum]KAJ5304826.1 hypothetical protein N7443_004486 [Penicillium atrosanguineum]